MCIKVYGAKLWNSLHQSLKNLNSYRQFQKYYKIYILNKIELTVNHNHLLLLHMFIYDLTLILSMGSYDTPCYLYLCLFGKLLLYVFVCICLYVYIHFLYIFFLLLITNLIKLPYYCVTLISYL